jgi:hypothetical protein
VTTTSVLPASLVVDSSDPRYEYLVRVADPAEPSPVLVRWKLGRREPWRCVVHGRQAEVECEHTFAAGLLLAEHLLGLTRMPELQPEGTTP